MRTSIIAEIGVNHNGDIDLAKRLIDAAAHAGADFAKFQTFKAEALVTKNTEKAAYQKTTTEPKESQLDMLRRYELDAEAHHKLKAHCQSAGIRFLSSAFDQDSLDFLIGDMALPIIKFGSGELLNAPLLFSAARRDVDVILSSGMANLGDIEQALMVLTLGYAPDAPDAPSPEHFSSAWSNRGYHARMREKVSLLQCTTSYPAEAHNLNLAVMRTLRQAFGLRTGFSDHSAGTAAAIAAVALGAEIIEKHITLDRNLPGPDHAASLEIGEFAHLVSDIRTVEQALGQPYKVASQVELDNAALARKSLVAAGNISEGDIFGPNNVGVKRPGSGLSPMLYWSLLGRRARRTYCPDELLEL